LGQKDTPNPVKTFFFRERRLFLGQKAIQFQRRTVFRVAGFGAFGLTPYPPCPKIVPAPLLLTTLIENLSLCSSAEAGFALNLFLNFEQT